MSDENDGERPLSEAEKKRLQRFERTRANRRGRKNPSIVPTDLARTSAFAPRRRGLVVDRNFQKVYAVSNQSVVEVTGRELGTQHRDGLYALFRLRAHRMEIPNPHFDPRRPQQKGFGASRPFEVLYETRTTWRTLLTAMGLTSHVNNLGTVLRTFEEIREVKFRVYRGNAKEYMQATEQGRLPNAGFSDNLLNLIDWDGVSLDSNIRVRYGEWVRQMFEMKHLISVNSDVYFRLKSDHAKSFWPYIDSQPMYTYVDEQTLGELAGRDVAAETAEKRRKFREDCRQAFDDMVRAGGLKEWSVEMLGAGRVKKARYHYVHALPRQAELPLGEPE
ncbi:MAG TPA: hypothetical protein VEH84_17165 [Alphaproteobacteria bacterium]|nr:hypothetical protein [Alphaproteobacteria bacterium]